ncbi:MAG: S46 family peptidase [Polyangiales bacterium]
MNRNLLTCALLFSAACGGTPKPAPVAPAAPAEPPPPAPVAAAPAPVEDYALTARKAFANPGGMWMPRQMSLAHHAGWLRAMGVSVPPENLTNPLAAPLNAVVSLGGCTASFVSPEGLVVTNHHCVQGALQVNSSPDKNYVEKGFLARSRTEEAPAGPAQRVSVAQAFRDVSKEVTGGLESISDPVKRKEELDKRTKTLVAGCEKGHPELRCDVVSFFRGAEYQLIEYLEIRDVRLVYAPPRSIGNYGGEVDNWAWPRHTGDWSFFRAYVGKDGKPADPSPDNVPFQPKHFLKVDRDGIKQHDFVMVAGYPGRTTRITTFAETKFDLDFTYPYSIEYFKQRYNLLESLLNQPGALTPDARIKAGVMKQGVQNRLEKSTGVLAGLQKGNALAQKQAIDTAVRAWANTPEHASYADAITRLDAFVSEQHKSARAEYDLAAVLSSSGHLRNALLFTRLADERRKPDAARRPGYQQRDLPRLEAQQKQFARMFDAGLDRANFRLALVRALALPEAERPWLSVIVGKPKGQPVDEASIDKALDRLYGGTKLAEETVRVGLLKNTLLWQLKSSTDPFVRLAIALWPTVKGEDARDDKRAGESILLAPRYAEAMQQALAGFVAPDANSTLRVTYGTVKPFAPDQSPFTTVSQIPAKNTGKEPFDAPQAELDAIAQRRFGPYADAALGGEVPVDFIADLDITGGNSGSAALDAQGELIGLAFDGNIEGVASDVVFDHATTRTILVDTRYMQWVMDALDGADHLLQEMGLSPQL